MKSKDIIIGAVYENTRHPGALYLGTGRDNKNKKIVVVRSDAGITGKNIINYSENIPYWNAFILTGKTLSVSLKR